MKFKKVDEPLAWTSEDLFYMLRNGYLNEVIDALEDEELQGEIVKAGCLLEQFFEEAMDQGIIGEM